MGINYVLNSALSNKSDKKFLLQSSTFSLTGYSVQSGNVEIVLVVFGANCGLYAFWEHGGAKSLRLAGSDMSSYFSYSYTNDHFTYTTKQAFVGIKIIR